MTRPGVGASLRRMLKTFVRNLPVVLVFCAAYFVFFSFLWGPLRPWKIAVGVGIVIGLCLGLDLRNPWSRVGRMDRGTREERWPAWRRVAATAAGALLCFAGVYQATGREVDVGNVYPLLSGLCAIVSLAFGVVLIVRAQPGEPWQPTARDRRSRLDSKEPPSAPQRTARTGGVGMRVPVPKRQPYHGIWGGVGSKPSAEVWQPGVEGASEAPDDPVPRRFRQLRLFRRTRSSEAPSSVSARIVLWLLGLGVLLGFLCWLSLHW